jgi:hypothetical protein
LGGDSAIEGATSGGDGADAMMGGLQEVKDSGSERRT